MVVAKAPSSGFFPKPFPPGEFLPGKSSSTSPGHEAISSKDVKELTPAICPRGDPNSFSFEPYGPKEAKRTASDSRPGKAKRGRRQTLEARSRWIESVAKRAVFSVWFPIAISWLGVVLKQGSPQDGGESSVRFWYLFV